MICRKCGFEIPEGAAFCSNCGEKVFYYEEHEPIKEEFKEEPHKEEPYREEPYREEPYREEPYREEPYREEPYREEPYREEPYREEPYREEPYREPYSGGTYPPPYNPPVNDKSPGLKEYLKWMLLYPLLMFIPGIGALAYFVICIIHALDKSYVARANYFKAILISQLIAFAIVGVIMFLIFVVFGSLVTSGISFFEEAYSGVYDEVFSGISTMSVFFGK